MTAAVPSQPPIRRPVVSPLLTSASGVDDTTRDRLVFGVGDRYAVLVELNLTPAVSADHIRRQFLDVFHAAFAGEPQQPPEPRRISVHYLQCLLTASEIRALAEQDKQSRTIYRIWPDYRVRAHLDRSVSTIKASRPATAARVAPWPAGAATCTASCPRSPTPATPAARSPSVPPTGTSRTPTA
jgi:hypothetical protein